jgi:hypothetical protein
MMFTGATWEEVGGLGITYRSRCMAATVGELECKWKVVWRIRNTYAETMIERSIWEML